MYFLFDKNSADFSSLNMSTIGYIDQMHFYNLEIILDLLFYLYPKSEMLNKISDAREKWHWKIVFSQTEKPTIMKAWTMSILSLCLFKLDIFLNSSFFLEHELFSLHVWLKANRWRGKIRFLIFTHKLDLIVYCG